MMYVIFKLDKFELMHINLDRNYFQTEENEKNINEKKKEKKLKYLKKGRKKIKR